MKNGRFANCIGSALHEDIYSDKIIGLKHKKSFFKYMNDPINNLINLLNCSLNNVRSTIIYDGKIINLEVKCYFHSLNAHHCMFNILFATCSEDININQI